MKRIISAVLCCLLLISFSACKEKSEGSVALTILMESNAERREEDFKLLAQVANPGKEIILNFEYLDYDIEDSAERETQLANYRSAIMAGEGPDIFILPSWNPELFWDDNDVAHRIEPLFPDMEDAMNNGVFYPLDDFIAESKHLIMDEHIEVVMNAGRTDEGQVVLPLLFDYELIWLERDKMLDYDVADDDLLSLLNDEDNYVKFMVGSDNLNWSSKVFTDYIDESGQALAITQDEMKEYFHYVNESADMVLKYGQDYTEYDETGFPVIKEWEEGPIYELSEDALLHLNRIYDKIYPLAVPSRDGGICAQITAFTAINRNSQHPQEAFNIIQYLYDVEMQVGGKITIDDGERAIHLGPEMSWIASRNMDGIETGKFNYTEMTYDVCCEALQDINSRITSARFTSEIDAKIFDFWNDISYGRAPEQEELDKGVEELYMAIKMIAAE